VQEANNRGIKNLTGEQEFGWTGPLVFEVDSETTFNSISPLLSHPSEKALKSNFFENNQINTSHA